MPKKKKGADKEKKARKKPCVNERETVSYEQQILDNNRQLARLRSRNEHLEGEVDALKAKLSQLEDDRSDVVAHLKRRLQQKTEEARELSDLLLAMEELRKDEEMAYKKKEDAMQLRYNTMETNLSAEVKLAAGKLNALEDWRLARIDLMRKFEIQEEQMEEQEKRHKETLYEAEKSLIIGKAKMQKEMEERLNDLAQSFREATNIRIADATHRTVRENIALNLELDAMYKVCRELDLKIKEYKEKERNLRLHSSLFQSEAQMTLNKLLEQNRLIDHLAEEHYNMKLAHGKAYREDAYKATKEQIVQNYRDRSVDAQQKARILEQNIQKTKEDRDNILKEMKDYCHEVKRLEEVLGAAKRYITNVLQVQKKMSLEDVCTSCYQDFEQKLHVLIDIVENKKCIETSALDESSLLEVDCSEYSHFPVDEPSIKLIQTGTQQDDVVARNNEVHPVKRTEETAPNIPQCLLTDSQSFDLASPKETDTPCSTDSADT